MSTYQIYDFIKDIDIHIKNKQSIDISSKSEAFKNFLFRMKIFQIKNKIKKNHPLFQEKYFLLVMYSVLYVAKKSDFDEFKFEHIEVVGGVKMLRYRKLKKLFN